MTSLTDRCREMLRTGATLDDVLGVMRREGQSRIASIGLLMELTGMTLREAKTTVHMSSVWGDLREETETFHEQLEETVEQLRKDERPDE